MYPLECHRQGFMTGCALQQGKVLSSTEVRVRPSHARRAGLELPLMGHYRASSEGDRSSEGVEIVSRTPHYCLSAAQGGGLLLNNRDQPVTAVQSTLLSPLSQRNSR